MYEKRPAAALVTRVQKRDPRRRGARLAAIPAVASLFDPGMQRALRGLVDQIDSRTELACNRTRFAR